MNDDLKNLYQEMIVDHSKHPHNFKKLENANKHGEGYNPLCGDRLELFLDVKDGKIADASFLGQGCAISTASASMMTDAIKGKSVQQAEDIFSAFHKLVTEGGSGDDEGATLGKLSVFAGVHEFPARVKCASLCWHTLKAALHGENQPAKTE